MYLTTPLLLLLTLSAGAFTSTLSPRAAAGYIAMFNNSDTGCSQWQYNPTLDQLQTYLPKGNGVPFSLGDTNRIGIGWGAGKDGFSVLTAYHSEDCSDDATNVAATIRNTAKTREACLMESDFGCTDQDGDGSPCFWQAVKASW